MLPLLSEPQLPELPHVAHKGARVITTELLARVYGVDTDVIHDNFRKNPERFTEGVHYHKLTRGNLREFKSQPEYSRLVDKAASHLVLWTERGAARHAKMISTDEAWAVFERLESVYFSTMEGAPARDRLSAREAAATFRSFHSIAKLIGLDPNQATIAANNATVKLTGVDALGAMGATHFETPEGKRFCTPTQLGHKLGGASAIAVNKLLERKGYQEQVKDSQGRSIWAPTAKGGPPLSKWYDVGKGHHGGRAVQQLLWSEEILPLLAQPDETPDEQVH